jgi:hypothetical protein
LENSAEQGKGIRKMQQKVKKEFVNEIEVKKT